MKTLQLCFFLVLTTFSFSQDWSTENYKYGEMYQGFIVTLDGEKIHGHIKYQNRVKMQDEIVFYRDIEDLDTKKRYRPKDLLEYQVADKYYHTLTNYGSKVGFTPKSALVKEEGCINVYVWYERSDEYNMLVQTEEEENEDFGDRKFPETIVIKEADKVEAFAMDDLKVDFAKNFSKMLSKNKDIAFNVKKSKPGYDFANLLNIIKEYNESCK